MKKYTILLIHLITIVFAGCSTKDWLDKKNKITLVVPASLKDCQAMMDNGDLLNQGTPNLHEVSSDDYYTRETFFQYNGPLYQNAYTWSRLFPYTVDLDWATSAQRIFACDLVLETLAKYSPITTNEVSKKNDITAQALFMRSVVLYELAQQYAPPYSSSSASTDWGTPMRLESDINIPTTRATVQQNYDQIINDLKQAKDLVGPVIPIIKTRASKIAVFSMMARVYLSMEKYTEAKIAADSCLQLYSTLLNYNTITPSNPFQRFNADVIFHYTLALSFLIGGGSYGFVDSTLYKKYDDNDLRKTLFFTVNTDKSITFKGSYFGDILCTGGPCTDEVYLIRAECQARAGKVTEAMDDLNTLLTTRWKTGTFVKYTATDADDALKQILSERRKEMIFRGTRWADLRRLNRDPRFATTVTRTINGKTYTLEPNSYKYTFPIPEDIIVATGIQQNAGWQ